MKFLDKKTNEIKDASSIRKSGDRILIKFQKDGREYSYNLQRIQILKNTDSISSRRKVYKINKRCSNCRKETIVYTYIVFSDNPAEDVTFPWNKRRLLRNQDVLAHMDNPNFEFYGFCTIGQNEVLDEKFAEAFPQKIKMRYHFTRKVVYFEAQNLCDHCRTPQDKFSIYLYVDNMIKHNQRIDWFEIDADPS